MIVCPRCSKTFKTSQGLAGHMRLRHSATIPQTNQPAYIPASLLKERAANAKIREELDLSRRRFQELETISKKKIEEQNLEITELQRKFALSKLEASNQDTLHKFANQKLTEERNTLQSKVKELQNQVSALESEKSQLKNLIEEQKRTAKVLTENLEYWKQQVLQNRISETAKNTQSETAASSPQSHRPSLFPPPPNLRNPTKGIRELSDWMHNLR